MYSKSHSFVGDVNEPRDRFRDYTSFDQLYLLYYKGLCAYASQYIPVGEAEEIVQDTMVWLWENHKTIEPDKSVKALLFKIVKNKALNRVKHFKISSRVHQLIELKFSEQFDYPDLYLGEELAQMLERALAKLPDDLRKVFVMSRIEGLSYKEIADRLEISAGKVNNRMVRTMQILRVELRDYLPVLLLLSGCRL